MVKMVPCHDDAEDGFEDAIVCSLSLRTCWLVQPFKQLTHGCAGPLPVAVAGALDAMAVKTTVRARVPALVSADPTQFEHMSPYHNLEIHIRHTAYLCRM